MGDVCEKVQFGIVGAPCEPPVLPQKDGAERCNGGNNEEYYHGRAGFPPYLPHVDGKPPFPGAEEVAGICPVHYQIVFSGFEVGQGYGTGLPDLDPVLMKAFHLVCKEAPVS